MSYRIIGIFGKTKRYWSDCGSRGGAGSAWRADENIDVTMFNDKETAEDRIENYIPESFHVVTIDGTRYYSAPDLMYIEDDDDFYTFALEMTG